MQGTQATPIGTEVDYPFAIGGSPPQLIVTLQRHAATGDRHDLGAGRSAVHTAGFQPAGVPSTVDFTRGLRIWSGRGMTGIVVPAQPDDYVTLVVDDTLFTNTSAELHYTLTPADVIRAVYGIGTGVSGWYSDGSGIVGQQAVLQDADITNVGQAASSATAYLGKFAQTVRGSLHLQTFSHGTTKYQAGGWLTLTNADVSLNGINFMIGSIRKRYHSNGLEEWDISLVAWRRR